MARDDLLLAFQDAVRGRYAVEAEIGRGGMGVVFLARDLTLDRPVAIKVLPPEGATDDDRASFRREASLAARLSHPHIVPIFAVEEAGGFTFFAMTYVDGGTLGARVAQHGPFPADEAGRVLREIAWALAYAHAQGIVHRDIKPDNILLEQGTRRALVTDFGIARPEHDDLGGSRLGTPGYASPEQATGDAADARSDIYALGAVGFHVLSGRPPFTGDARSIVTRQLERAAPKLREFAPGTPRELAAVVDRCLAIDPAERFPSAEALADALGRALPAPRELPPILRTWVVGRQELLTMLMVANLPFLGLFAGSMLFLLASLRDSTVFNGYPWIVLARALLVALAAWTLLGASRVMELRKLLASGISLSRLRAALRLREEQYAEEAMAAPKPAGWARLSYLIGLGHLGTAALAVIVMIFGLLLGAGIGDALRDASSAVLQFGGAYLLRTGVLLLLLSIFFPGRRQQVRPTFWKLRLRFWMGRAGEWMANLAGWGLDRRDTPTNTANLPTELALADAAIALWQSLPAEQRKALGDVKLTVEQLSQYIEKAKRAEAVRPGSARRLREAMEALETIRVGLLRLRAGGITLDQITTELDLARTAAADIERLAEAQAEARQLLSTPAARGRPAP